MRIERWDINIPRASSMIFSSNLVNENRKTVVLYFLTIERSVHGISLMRIESNCSLPTTKECTRSLNLVNENRKTTDRMIRYLQELAENLVNENRKREAVGQLVIYGLKGISLMRIESQGLRTKFIYELTLEENLVNENRKKIAIY